MIENINDNQVDLTKIQLYMPDAPLQEENLHLLDQLPHPLPKRYIELLKISNGGSFEKDTFDFYDECFKYNSSDSVKEFYGLLEVEDNNGIIYNNKHENIWDGFPQNLLAFAKTPGGDLICFDYRNDPESANPPIVYWNHEADENGNAFVIAKDLDTFLSMLRVNED